jgi:hypothetical protein
MNALHVLAWFGEKAVRLVDAGDTSWLRVMLSESCVIKVCDRASGLVLASYALTPWGELLPIWSRP